MDLETLDWLQQMIQTSPQTILFISHHEDFLTQTADTIIHLRQIKHRKEAETIVEHLAIKTTVARGSNNSSSSPSKLPTINEPTEKQWRSIVASVSKSKHPYETLRIALLDVSWQRK